MSNIVKKYYDKEYFNKDYFTNGMALGKSGYVNDTFFLKNDIFSHQAKMVKRILQLNHKKVLDVGCAKCNLVHFLRLYDVYADGVDISDWCKDNSHSPDNHICCNIELGINSVNNYYDAIVSFETFEHFANPEYVIKELYRILKNNGVFFATISQSAHTHDPSGVSLYSYDKWTKLLSQYFVVDTKTNDVFKQESLVKDYNWSTHCYRCKK